MLMLWTNNSPATLDSLESSVVEGSKSEENTVKKAAPYSDVACISSSSISTSFNPRSEIISVICFIYLCSI